MSTPLDPARDHRISLAEAVDLTRRFRHDGPSRLGDAMAFNGPQVMALLSQPGCVGLRIYQGLTAAGEPSLVLVGVDARGDDLTDGMLLDLSFPCPPWCPDGSALKG